MDARLWINDPLYQCIGTGHNQSHWTLQVFTIRCNGWPVNTLPSISWPSAKNVYDVIFSSLQMMGIGKYHCTGWPDEHSNIQWTTQCSLSSQVHCASMWMMAITRKLHLLHFSRNEGMPSIPEKWSGRYTHLGPMWFPNAGDFRNWGYTLNSRNLKH